MATGWVALFSGGKDSSWALHRAQKTGREIEAVLTAEPAGDSYLFHTPATELTALLAESMGLQHRRFPVAAAPEGGPRDAGEQGDRELATLNEAIADLALNVEGLVVGAVESDFQRTRIERVCEHHDIELYAPLWHCDPVATLEAMIAAGFDIRIVAVAAAGLDATWLDRRLNAEAIAALQKLSDTYGIHPMGEGGEYETLVVDGPHLDRRLEIEAEPTWDGTRGQLQITDARLADR